MLLLLVVQVASDMASLAHTWARLACLQETVAQAERQAVALVELPHSLAVAAAAALPAAMAAPVAQAESGAAVAAAAVLEMETHLEQVEQAAQVALGYG
jgi:hypothetical protein